MCFEEVSIPGSMKEAERNNGPGVNEALDFHLVS